MTTSGPSHWRRILQFVLAACLLAPLAAGAQGLTLNVKDEGSYPLPASFSWLEDKGGQMSITDITKHASQNAAQDAFKPLAQSGPGANFGLTRSAIWLRSNLQVQASGPADWLVEIAYPPLDHVDVYSQNAEGAWVRQSGGDALPYASRAIAHRNHVMAVQLRPGPNTLYLRIESQGTVSAPAALWRPAALWAHDQGVYSALSLYFGLLFGLLAYNLLLYFSVRDINYLIYVAFAGGMALAQGALTGLGGQFVWPGQTWWNGVSPPAGMSIAAVFGVWFARGFLAAPRRCQGWTA